MTQLACPNTLAELASAWTPYRYGFNNPLTFTDPTGMFEYSDGYRKLDSENNTGAVAFSGKYTDGGNVFVGVNSYVDDNGNLNILHSYVIREPGRANTFGAGEFGDITGGGGGDPTYSYNGQSGLSASELYTNILIDQAAKQFGIKDLAA